MPTSREKEILLSKMYNGEYVKFGNNIGHEIINLFKADNGKHYIYIPANGTIAQKHHKKVKYVLLTRSLGKHTVEILAKATELELIAPDKDNSYSRQKEERIQEIHNYQEPIADDIKYGGVSIKTILDKNKFNGNYEGASAIWATFAAGNVTKPTKPLYIAVNRDTQEFDQKQNVIYIKNNLFGRNQRRYICDSDSDYDVISKVLENSSVWSPEPFPKVSAEGYTSKKSFMKIIHKEYDELSYSNMLSYFFAQDHRRFCRFAAEVLDIHDFDDTFQISREKNNIDILIESEKYIVVIENKIKSGINGIQDSDEDMQIISQLSKYYEYADDIKEQREAKYFIFTPNYQRVDLKRYSNGKEYTHISYLEILNFFEKEDHTSDEYYEEFLKALEIHASKSDNELSDEMLRRFIEAIKLARSE